MSFLQTSQCQGGKERRLREPQSTVISEMCPRKDAQIVPPLSPGLRQPPAAAPVLALLRAATQNNDHRGASRWERERERRERKEKKNHTLISHCQKTEAMTGKKKKKLENNRQRQKALRRLRGPVRRALMTSGRKHFSDFRSAEHPGVGRWLTECVWGRRRLQQHRAEPSRASLCALRRTLYPDFLKKQNKKKTTACRGGFSRCALVSDSAAATGGARSWRGSERRVTEPERRREAELWPVRLNTLHLWGGRVSWREIKCCA